MNAGRELDALIAEKIFNRNVCVCERPHLAFGHPEFCFDCKKGTTLDESYSTTWAGAGKVMDKIRWFRLNKGINDWDCYVDIDHDQGESLDGETGPHAVCLAALQTTEGTKS